MLVDVQILRAVAAAMVVWHHARHEVGLLGPLGPGTLLPWWAGVDLFFVISGLVIVQASLSLAGTAGARRRFLAHRIARVVPLYWLTTLAYLAVALAAPGVLSEAGALARQPGPVAASFLFWPVARPDGSVQPLYGLGWTLNYEMAFYALFALGLGFSIRGTVMWLAAVLGVLVAANGVLALPLPFAFWGDPIVLEFAFGAALGLARAEGLRLPRGGRLVLAALGLAGMMLAAHHLGGEGEVPGFTRPLLVGVPALMLVAAASLMPAAGAPGRAGLAAPIRALVRLGDASYALYLVHPFALRVGRAALARVDLAGALHPWGSLLAMTGLAILSALAVHRFVERPLTRRLRSALEPRENRGGAMPRPVSTAGEDR